MRDVIANAGLGFDAVLFDLDGVVTSTARLHAAAWKELFDDLLAERLAHGAPGFRPFDAKTDYLSYVDGRPREEGLRSFLAARGVQIGDGASSAKPTIQGLSARKDALFLRRLKTEGVDVFDSTLALIRALRDRGVRTAVVTSSRNGREVLRAAAIDALFDVRVDGIDAEVLRLEGKPHPDPFLRAAELLGVKPCRAIVIEDSVPGVEAGRRGGFGLVVGVDRGGNRDALIAEGADVVVADLSELHPTALNVRLQEKSETCLAWRVEEEGFDPARERDMESLFTVGNGYVGVRGALDTPVPESHADMFIGGVYDRKHEGRSYSELELLGDARGDYEHTELVSMPFPFRLRILVGGVPLDLAAISWRSHRRTLDLRRGVLHIETQYQAGVGRGVVVRTQRCASLADRHLLLQEVTVVLENHSATLELDASLDDPELATAHPHLVRLDASQSRDLDSRLDVHRFRTQASGVEIVIAATTLHEKGEAPAICWRVPGRIGETLTFRRTIAIYTTSDAADPLAAATQSIASRQWQDFDRALVEHQMRWGKVWDRADVEIVGSPSTEQALRFNAYHSNNARGSRGAACTTWSVASTARAMSIALATAVSALRVSLPRLTDIGRVWGQDANLLASMSCTVWWAVSGTFVRREKKERKRRLGPRR